MNAMDTDLRYRQVARIVVEAVTPICVGSGEATIETDSEVALDVNGLPYIPGTAIAGVLRHAMDEADSKSDLFGYQDDNDGGLGSRLIVSEARMAGSDGKAVDGLLDEKKDDFLDRYHDLPVRQHVRINGSGVAADTGKFDGQVAFKGTRFVFELELKQETANDAELAAILNQLKRSDLRFGGGSRNGFGKVEVKSCVCKSYDLGDASSLDEYLQKSSSLADELKGEEFEFDEATGSATIYKLTLRPDDFFLFGAGHGDKLADMIPVTESVVEWNNGKGDFKDKEKDKLMLIIPATSLKGALRHRTLYHLNRMRGNFADRGGELREKDVEPLFGYAGPENEGRATCGKVLMSDIIEELGVEKYANHVAVDRFTGGTIDGALFTERTVNGLGLEYVTEICLTDAVDSDLQAALEKAMTDVCSGLLPLGGGVNRGNGCFTGELTRDGKQIYPQQKQED